METKKIGLYVRVSTDAQAEMGYSIEAQKERLVGFCVSKGWKNYEFYIDPGCTGSHLDRPAMKKMMTDVYDGKLSSVVVFKLDRLSRSQKDTLFLIEDVFLPQKVDVISLHENLDTSTPYGRAMIGILSAFAQLERENIFLRTRMGMLERVKLGYWMGGGATPFGYDYDEKQGILIPNGDAQKICKIFQLYISGFSAQKIADMMGLKQDKNVTDILKRKTYMGLIPYKGKVYPGRHAPLISAETFDLAQRSMESRSLGARATDTANHLLSGLVWCGGCGARMRYIKWGEKGYKLRCYGQDSSKKYMTRAEKCTQQAVWTEELEAVVLKDLFRLSVNLEEKPGENSTFADPLVELENEVVRREKGLKRLYDLYAAEDDDSLLETIAAWKKELERLKTQVEAEKTNRATSKELEKIWDKIGSIADTWNYFSEKEQQNLIRECVKKIVVTGETAEIFYTFQTRKNQMA